MWKRNNGVRVCLCLALCMVLGGRAGAVDNPTLRQWGSQSMSQMAGDFRLSSGLYAHSLTDRWADYAWGEGILFGALVAAATVDTAYLPEAQTVADLIQSNYWCTSGGLSGYNASAGNCGDRYTDDNAWIALALLELHSLTGDGTHLNRAAATMNFVMAFENGPGDTPDGGIRWHETSTSGAAICSTAPACLANLMLYQKTGNTTWRSNGQRLYDWMLNDSGLQLASGLFHETAQGPLGYQTAVVIQSAVKLYEITGNGGYLTDAYHMAAALETHFVKAQTHALGQTGKWCGHDMTNAMADLYEVDGDQHWLDLAAGYLQYLHDHCKFNGRYPTSWDDTSGATSSELIDQASVARAYWTLARTEGGTAPSYHAVVYNDCGYGSWSLGLNYGDYRLGDLTYFGISDNSISSMTMASGYTATLYDSDNFGGSSLTKSGDVWCLVGDGWNDRATSLRIQNACAPTTITPYLNVNGSGWAATAIETVVVGDTVAFGPSAGSGSWSWSGPGGFSSSSREITIGNIQPSQAGNYIVTFTNSCGTVSRRTFTISVINQVQLFQHCNYYGWRAGFDVGSYTHNDLIAEGAKNDDASSVLVEPGYQVTFFWDDNFRGTRLVKTADDSCLVDEGWNDKASSMIVTYEGEGEDVATLYQHCSYGGWAATFDIGSYTAADITAAGGLNNDASSVRVSAGFQVIFYADDNFQGATLTKTADDWCLVDDGWNDVISSMKVLTVD